MGELGKGLTHEFVQKPNWGNYRSAPARQEQSVKTMEGRRVEASRER